MPYHSSHVVRKPFFGHIHTKRVRDSQRSRVALRGHIHTDVTPSLQLTYIISQTPCHTLLTAANPCINMAIHVVLIHGYETLCVRSRASHKI